MFFWETSGVFGSYCFMEWVKVYPQNVQSITKWPNLKNIRGLRGFLGLTWYYRKFVKNNACIVGPFTSLLKKKSFV